MRVPGAADPHEMLIRAMVGQQVTVAAARTALTRLVDELGATVDAPDGASDPFPTRLFPTRLSSTRLFSTMAAIAEHGHEVLRGPVARIRAITGAATALAAGTLIR